MFRSRQFSTAAAPVSFVFSVRRRDSNALLSTQIKKLWLMKIWRMNSRLKTFSLMDVAIFDFTLVTVAMVTGV